MKLGYPPEQVAQIVDYIDANWHDRGRARIQARAPGGVRLLASTASMGGGRSISWRGHLRMMARRREPFISGAISKTINMPEDSTVEDIMEAYSESWKFGLKAVAIYRDNSEALAAAFGRGEERSTRRLPPQPHRRQWRPRLPLR